MKAKRKRHAPQFKAKVALEAIKALETIQQIAKTHEVHPVQVSEWKKVLVDAASEAFSRGAAPRREETFEKEREQLLAKIGQLTVEVDFLKKKSKQLGL
jgi:transposase